VLFQAVSPCRGGLNSGDEILKHDVVHGLLEFDPREPAPVRLRPRRASIMMAMAQQKTG
jgi:hypothetical protein